MVYSVPMRRIIFIALGLIGFAYVANAADLNQLQSDYRAGRYGQVLHMSEGATDTDTALLRAQTLLSQVLLGESQSPKSDARQAIEIVDQVLAHQAENPEAVFLSALALGYYGRAVGKLEAWRTRLPIKIKARIEQAQKVLPEDARIKAMLGAWHMSVVYKAGAKLAQKKYGASENVGKDLLLRAHRQAPRDIAIAANAATMIYVLDTGSNRDEIVAIIKTALSTPARDYTERRLQAILRTFESKLDRPRKARKYAKSFLDW